MENNLHNNYLFKALDNYPYDLEKAVEALNYALSYEPENPMALCLMAKIHVEQLGEYDLAKEYYEKALACRIDLPEIYPDYIRLLINNEDFKEAQKLIDFAFNVKGIDKAGIQLGQAYLFEALMEFEKAEVALKEAKMLALNNHFIDFVEDVIKRVSRKRKIKKNEEKQLENVIKKEDKQQSKNWFSNQLNNLL